MAFAVSGFATVAQNWISKQIASNFYKKAPFLAILGALTLGNNQKTSLNIGRPNSGEILSAKMISPAEKKKLQGINSYLPRIQAFKTNNTKFMTTRDTMPVVASASTLSHGQAMQNAAKFNWSHMKTPILIWHEDKIRAGQEGTREGQGLSMSQLIDEATEIGMQDQVDTLADTVWNGNPSDQTADLWDAGLGIVQMLSATNTYANVDRTQASNSVWRAQVDSTLKAVDVNKIVDDANLTKNIRVQGNGINLLLTTTALYQQFKAQILAAGSGGRVLPEGLPEMVNMGVKKEVLQKDNVFIMYDPTCPTNNVAAFDLTTIKFMVHPQQNFRVDSFVDISKYSEGAKDADLAYVHTRFMLTNDNPFLNVLYTAVGT